MNRDILTFTSDDAAADDHSIVRLSDDACQQVSIKTEKSAPRQRRIVASVAIPQSLEQVWVVLTDYERLADFIPNLTSSRLLSCPNGGIRLEQIGAQCFLNFQFCARVILDMTEVFPQEIGFSMVEGDFKKFMGRWTLSPALLGDEAATILSYELMVQPPLAMPVQLIERHICHNLTQNLMAICDRATEQFA
ncbi:cyclase dehydrase [Leptolyngbya sp. Heron Island J]|uniref:SRPBCC family protein n=1 Tax=Leptolyngbya sp. Heron Island J TaxID=1385935 RepID=UPI0003B94A46|nr:SRPBCC family protein [Leptolyngbya sp. Heron Island J]ESA33528.1 cyclase dehydrase [Leptolyngbya sp. Heron Island J]